MGLRVSHGCWYRSSAGFNEFRHRVGLAAGLPYAIVTEGLLKGNWRLNVDWDRYADENYLGRWHKQRPTWSTPRPDMVTHDQVLVGWPSIQDDVLYLLVHSDCEGQLRRGYLPRLVARLEQVEPTYRAISGTFDEGQLRLFITGLKLAVRRGEHVEFH